MADPWFALVLAWGISLYVTVHIVIGLVRIRAVPASSRLARWAEL